ncbi:MAG: hypothetical protein WC757_00210 [Candidatus Paceibacterota bacterium]|jgi:hypothetical protein
MTKQAKGCFSWIFNRPTKQQKAEAMAKEKELQDANLLKGIALLSGKTLKIKNDL